MKLETLIDGPLKDDPFVKRLWPVLGLVDDIPKSDLPVFHPDHPSLFVAVSTGGTSQVHVFAKCQCDDGPTAMDLINKIFAAGRDDGNEMAVRVMPAVESQTSFATNKTTFRATTRFTLTGKKGNIMEPRKDELGQPILVGTGAGAG